jgi:hypothetical protein
LTTFIAACSRDFGGQSVVSLRMRGHHWSVRQTPQHEPGESNLARVYELVQRTNQLNIASERYSRDEVRHLIHGSECDCYVISCTDKYGAYGHVGFIVIALFVPLVEEGWITPDDVVAAQCSRAPPVEEQVMRVVPSVGWVSCARPGLAETLKIVSARQTQRPIDRTGERITGSPPSVQRHGPYAEASGLPREKSRSCSAFQLLDVPCPPSRRSGHGMLE